MTEVDVTFVFDEILSRHMERLFGSRYGIGGLQLRIGTIACLTLLAEQLEKEQPSSERYTTETLKGKLAEFGFQDEEKAQSLIQEMSEKGYLISDDQGGITAGKPAVSMARLLERVFPKLPGKTLAAYFIQAIDEVVAGRKTTEIAVSHFDQTLKMQGVPLRQQKSDKTQAATKEKKGSAGNIVREAPNILKSTVSGFTPAVEESGGIRIIGSADDGFRYKLKNIQKPAAGPLEPPPDSTEQLSSERPSEVEPPIESTAEEQPSAMEPPAETFAEEQAPAVESSAEQRPENVPAESVAPVERPSASMDSQPTALPEEPGKSQAHPAQPISDNMECLQEDLPAEPEPQTTTVEDNPPQAEGMAFQHGIESSPSDQEPGEPEETRDDLIEKEIAGFQDELASLCPLCKEGKVKEEKTGTGKPYFKCTNKACNLVSWGRPHHIACPVCNNPFLIEVSADEEKVSLQCPRATCKYQSTLSQEADHGGKAKDAAPAKLSTGKAAKPRRRVVRRRLVKKKK